MQINKFINFRSYSHAYTLRSHPEYLFWTGLLSDGRQALITGLSSLILVFDRAGSMLEVRQVSGPSEDLLCWGEEAGLMDSPISVKRFQVSGSRTRIEDHPGHLEDFRKDPSDPSFLEWERQEYPRDIEEWLETGRYVYYDGGADFFVNANGEVESS